MQDQKYCSCELLYKGREKKSENRSTLMSKEEKSLEGPQREAPGRSSYGAKQRFPSLKGQAVKKTNSYLKILDNTKEPTIAVLAQHTKIFTSLRIAVLKHFNRIENIELRGCTSENVHNYDECCQAALSATSHGIIYVLEFRISVATRRILVIPVIFQKVRNSMQNRTQTCLMSSSRKFEHLLQYL